MPQALLRVLRPLLLTLTVGLGLILHSASFASGIPALQVSERMALTQLTPYLSSWVDTGGASTIRDVAALPDSAFSPYQHQTISEGFSSDAWWFRFTLRNDSSVPIRLHLDSGNPFLSQVEVFAVDRSGHDGTRIDASSGLGRADSSASGAPTITVPANSASTYHLRIMSATPMIAPVTVVSNFHYLEDVHQSRWISGLVYGALFGLLVYNLLLLATVREGIFFSFVVYIGALLAALAGVDGLIHEALPDSGSWPTTLTFMALNLAIGMLALLTCFATGQSEASTKCRAVGSGLAGLNMLAIQSFLFLPQAQAILTAVTIATVTLAATTALALFQIPRSSASIRSHLIASVAFNIAGVAVLLAFIGVLPNFPLALMAIKITVAAKLALLSMALGQRINELKRTQSRLELVAQDAVDESRASNQLLERMGDRIRTPLNGVIGLAESLGNTRLDREQRQTLSGIQGSGESLLKLLNDAMDFSLIENGKMTLELSNYDLETVLNDCITLSTYQAREKQLDINLSIRPNTATDLRGDPARLRQIIMYFVGNALEHTDSGSITIHARGAQDKSGRAVTQISVTDTGVGISREAQQTLFDGSSQQEIDLGQAQTGSGLGLPIAKKLVDMMNGAIGFRSTPQAGSTFWIEIPEKRSLLDAFANKKPHASGERKQSVLIVDAHAAYTRAMLEDRITRDIDLKTAPGIQAAKDILLEREAAGARFDLVLFDQSSIFARKLGTPDEDNLKVIREKTKTALMRSSDEDLQRYAKGFTFEVDKPHTGRQLATVVHNVLIGEPAAYLDNWSHDDEVRQQLADLSVLVVDDNEVSTMVTCGFLQRMGIQHADVALDGEEALSRYRSNRGAYDLVLMDCEMPRMDGYQAARAIREWENSKRLETTTIIAISAHVSPEMSRKSLDAGMQDHMPKPLQFSSLRDRLLSLFPDQSRSRDNSADQAA